MSLNDKETVNVQKVNNSDYIMQLLDSLHWGMFIHLLYFELQVNYQFTQLSSLYQYHIC